MDVIRAEAARIERELAAIDAEERALSAEASADTVANRSGALAWVRAIGTQWGEHARSGAAYSPRRDDRWDHDRPGGDRSRI